MRILYLTHQYFPRHVGGTEVFTRSVRNRAAQAGHSTLLVTTHESGRPEREHIFSEKTEFDGLPVLELHFNLAACKRPAQYEYDNPLVGREMAAILADYKPQIVHCMHPMKLSKSALDACYKKNIPVVISLADFWLLCPRHSLLTWDNKLCTGPDKRLKCSSCLHHLHGYPSSPQSLADLGPLLLDLKDINGRAKALRASALKARRLIALSKFQKDIFTKNGYPEHRIEVMQHGIETTELSKFQKSKSPGATGQARVLGFIGSIVPIKGLHVLFDALKQCKDACVELWVYGELREADDYVESIRQAASRDPRIKLKGRFAPEQLGQVLSEMDALLVPAVWYENEPLVVKAAQFMGIPLFLSDIGSLTEMVEQSRTGRLIEAGNPDAWANAIREAAIEPLLRPDASAVRTVDQNAAEFLSIYEFESKGTNGNSTPD